MGLRLGATSGQGAAEARVEAELSQLVTQLTNEINWYMHARGLTRADLAGRMGVSAGRVSQVLSGGENLTLRTLAGLATALDARFSLELKPREPTNTSSGELTGMPARAETSDPGQRAAAPGYRGAIGMSPGISPRL
jgi:transcriptional regulator with XRE-family HTH domain